MAGQGTRRYTAMFASRPSILVYSSPKADPGHRVASRPRISSVGVHIGPSESHPCGCEGCSVLLGMFCFFPPARARLKQMSLSASGKFKHQLWVVLVLTLGVADWPGEVGCVVGLECVFRSFHITHIIYSSYCLAQMFSQMQRPY